MVRKIAEMKMLFVIWGLRPGGAERAFVNIVNIIHNKIKPVVVVLGGKEGFANDLKDELEVYYLYKKNRWDIFRLLIRLSIIMRKEKPECIISFGYYANQLVVLSRYISALKTPVCISERTETVSSLEKMNFQVIRKLFLRITYKRTDKIIAVSKRTRDSLINHFGMHEGKVSVIYNPVDLGKIRARSFKEVDHPWFNKKDNPVIIAVGRLVEEKGFSYLIRAFSMVLNEKEKARLVILGEGGERQKLEKLVLELHLKERVALLGYQQNPYKFMAKSQIFVLSSLYEGFPNVVLEAMACGVPVIATHCISGPDEIITDEVNGLLVPVRSEESLAEAMIKLLEGPELRDRFSGAGRKRSKDFSLSKVIHKYEKLLMSIS
jgi:glycosyltransferase involved in cell wall biosynthesis